MARGDMINTIRAHELHRKPKKIPNVPFVYHNGDHFLYKCEYAQPMIGMADTLKDVIDKRNAAIKAKVGPFILEGMSWKSVKNLEDFIKKIFFEMEGKVYWNVAYVTPRQIYFPGDLAERRYTFALVKFMGRTLMSHSIVWTLHHGVYMKGLKHINGDKLDSRISNLE
jgi:hypothetical protein